jgi:hypothetical protein
MILTNKRTTYTVNHSNETAKLVGNISLNENNVIENFNGSFINLLEEDGVNTNLGGFSYSEEMLGETLSKSIYGVPFSAEENLVSLLNDTIDRIKTEVETDILSE